MYMKAEKITEFSNACFVKMGMTLEDADIITKTMLEADLKEIHSHGFLRLPIYIKRMEKGFIQVHPQLTFEKETNSMAVLNGGHAAGQIVGRKAMEKAIEKAKENGLGLVLAKNSNHFGIAAHYSLMAAKQNMLGIVMSNVQPLMPAIGGAEKVIGNNPISIASPSGNGQPLVLDMALSNVPLGKILVAKATGQTIPEGWGVNKEGQSTNNPEEVLDGGFLAPVGGPKGFGLAIFVEILTGVLANSEFSKTIPSMYDLTEKQSISHFMLAIDISQFSALNEFKDNMSILASFVKDSKKTNGVDEIYLPGEPEFMKEKQNKSQGVPINEEVVKELLQLGEEIGITFPN